MKTVVNERLFNAIDDLDLEHAANKESLKKLYPFDLKKQLTKEDKVSFLKLANTLDVYRSLTQEALDDDKIVSSEGALADGKPPAETLMRLARYKLFMQQEYEKIASMEYSKTAAGKTNIISDEDLIYLEDISKIDPNNPDTLKVLQNHCKGLNLAEFTSFPGQADWIKILAEDKIKDIKVARNREIDAKKETLVNDLREIDATVDAFLNRSRLLHDNIRAKIDGLEQKIIENEKARGIKRDAIKAKSIFAAEPKKEKQQLKDLESDYTALKTAVKLLQQADERLVNPDDSTDRTKIKVESIKARSELLEFKMSRPNDYDLIFGIPASTDSMRPNTLYCFIEDDKLKYCVKNCSNSQCVEKGEISCADIGIDPNVKLSGLSPELKGILKASILYKTDASNQTFSSPYNNYDPRNPNIGFAADNREFQNIQLQAEYIEQDIKRGEKLLALATNVHNDPKKYRDTLPGSSNFLMKVAALSDVDKKDEFIHSIIRKGSTEIDKEASEGRFEVETVYRGVRLNSGDIKQSKCTTDTNTLYVEQDHTGKITYHSEKPLAQQKDLELLALEIAETALLNYKPGDKIELNGSEKDAQLSSMVHAALLILTETDKNDKTIPFDPKCIKNNVVGASVPSWFGPWNKTFMYAGISATPTNEMKKRLTNIYNGRNEHKTKFIADNPPVGIEFTPTPKP